jgi:hypothetical protein
MVRVPLSDTFEEVEGAEFSEGMRKLSFLPEAGLLRASLDLRWLRGRRV